MNEIEFVQVYTVYDRDRFSAPCGNCGTEISRGDYCVIVLAEGKYYFSAVVVKQKCCPGRNKIPALYTNRSDAEEAREFLLEQIIREKGISGLCLIRNITQLEMPQFHSTAIH